MPIGDSPSHLLTALPHSEFERLLPSLELVPMQLGDVLYESGSKLRHVYFPTTSIVSLLYVMIDGSSAEIAVVASVFPSSFPSQHRRSHGSFDRQFSEGSQMEARAKSMKARNDAFEELPACRVDPALLRQLISNALKFSRNRRLAIITVGVQPEIGQPDRLAYFVRDNGIGIESRPADKLFKLFSQLNLPEGFEGTGAGLEKACRIVERMGSHIWAEASPDGGAMFTSNFPLRHERFRAGHPVG